MSDLVQFLARSFAQCSSSEISQTRQGEAALSEASSRPDFVRSLLILIQSEQADILVRQLACIYLKNFLHKRWDLPSESTSSEARLAHADRDLIKSQIIPLYMQVCVQHERQLGAHLLSAIENIAAVDFPTEWTSLIEVLAQLSQRDALSSYLGTKVIDQVLFRYRSESPSNDVLAAYKYHILPYLEEPLLRQITQLTQTYFNPQAPPSLGPTSHLELTVLLHNVKIFWTLISVDLPEFIEDNTEKFFGCFLIILRCPADRFPKNHFVTPSLLTDIKAEICSALGFYASRYNEEYQPYVQQTYDAVLGCYTPSEDDKLKAAIIGFLTSIAKFNWTPSPFLQPPQNLLHVCESIIFPNLRLQQADLELLTESPLEFVQVHLDPSEGTIRANVVDLIRALYLCHEAALNSILPDHLSRMMSETNATTDPMQKQIMLESLIQSIIAVVVKSETRSLGVTQVRPVLQIEQFMSSCLLLTFTSSDSDAWALSICATLKFISTFRNQLSKPLLLQLLPSISKHLSSSNVAVHTHAAATLENLLLARDSFPADRAISPPYKFCIGDLEALVTESLKVIWAQVTNPNAQYPENEYLLRCIFGILVFLKDQVKYDSLVSTLQYLNLLMQRQKEMSVNPYFRHYLFECLALSCRLCAVNQIPIDMEILKTMSTFLSDQDNDVYPYILQVLGIIIDYAKEASPLYLNLLTNILAEQQWIVSTARVPGLIRVLVAYFRNAELFFEPLKNSMETIMTRFQYCLNHKRLASNAFDLLTQALYYLPIEFFSRFLQPLTAVLIHRSSSCVNTKLIETIAYILAIVDVKSPQSVLPKMLSTVPTEMANEYFPNLYIPSLVTLSALKDKKKISILALFKLLTSPEVVANEALLHSVLEKIAGIVGLIPKQEVSRMIKKSTAAEELQEFLRESQNPVEAYEGSFNVLQAAKVSVKAKELPQVAGEQFQIQLVECLKNSLLQQKLSQDAALQKIVSMISVSVSA